MAKKPRNAFCSFCRKSYLDAGPLVEGPDNVYICGECIELSQSIIIQEKRRRGIASSDRAAMDPLGIGKTMDRLIPRQDDAKFVLSEAAWGREEGKGRVLLVGPSQSTAMLLAKAVAFACDVPFAAGDASGLEKPGKGNLFLELLMAAADFDLESAQRGVVFVGGMERPEAQEALEKLWQENISKPGHGFTMELGRLLFVCGASFGEFDDAIAPVGRGRKETTDIEVLKAAGARPEWVAALAAVARVQPLDEESLARVIRWVDFRLGGES